MFVIELGLTVLKVRIVDLKVNEVSPEIYKGKAVARNMGYLPTKATEQAIKNKMVGKLNPFSVTAYIHLFDELCAYKIAYQNRYQPRNIDKR